MWPFATGGPRQRRGQQGDTDGTHKAIYACSKKRHHVIAIFAVREGSADHVACKWETTRDCLRFSLPTRIQGSNSDDSYDDRDPDPQDLVTVDTLQTPRGSKGPTATTITRIAPPIPVTVHILQVESFVVDYVSSPSLTHMF